VSDFPLHFMSAKVVMRPRPETGEFGVIAVEWIQKGEMISVWGGHVITAENFARLPESTQCHTVQIEEGIYLASIPGPETSDYINHSCEPNLGMSDSITMVAMRDISPGEDICFDYAMTDSTAIDEFDCECGRESCRERVTGNDWQISELWDRYDGYFSPYLQRKIDRLRIDELNIERTA
jgi:SET domain-containing protein